MSDTEVIALSLAAEYMGIDSECQLFRMLLDCLRSRIECSAYNRRYRALPPIYPPFANVWAKASPRPRLSDCRQYAAEGMQDQP